MLREVAAVVAALCLFGAGCGKSAEPPSAGDKRAPARSAVKDAAVLEGSVRLAEGFELPSLSPEAMEKKVLDQLAQAAPPPSCTPTKIVDRQPVRLSDDGHLTGVLVALSKFARQPTRPPRVYDVAIEDCRLTPQLVVAMKGDRLRVVNRVDYPFMPTIGEDPMVRTLSLGQTYDVPLDQPGVRALTCGFTAPCGRTEVIVMLHPLYAVSDARGSFRFDDFPAGEPITLSAWHPLFQESQLEVRLEPGEHKRIELTLTPISSAPADETGATGAPARAKSAPGAGK